MNEQRESNEKLRADLLWVAYDGSGAGLDDRLKQIEELGRQVGQRVRQEGITTIAKADRVIASLNLIARRIK